MVVEFPLRLLVMYQFKFTLSWNQPPADLNLHPDQDPAAGNGLLASLAWVTVDLPLAKVRWFNFNLTKVTVSWSNLKNLTMNRPLAEADRGLQNSL